MIQLSEEAARVRDEYLHEVHTYVSASGTADPDEVVRELREHIDRELLQAPQPAATADLRAVLGRLGDARQWIDEEHLVWWRKVLLRVRCGPNDWRLAYLSLGLLVLGGVLLALLPVLLAASFLVSRAALAGGRILQPGEKWLVYPSLVIVCVLLAGALLVLPPFGAGAAAFMLVEEQKVPAERLATEAQSSLPGFPRGVRAPRYSDVECLTAGISTGVAAAGLWWSLLSASLLLRRPRAAAMAIFRPFLDRLSRRKAAVWLGMSILLLAIGGVATAAGAWYLATQA